MLRITIDLVPYGIGTPRTLHVIEIANDLEDSRATGGKVGSYKYQISRKFVGRHQGAKAARKGRISGFPRTRLNSVRLLQRVLNDAYPKDAR